MNARSHLAQLVHRRARRSHRYHLPAAFDQAALEFLERGGLAGTGRAAQFHRQIVRIKNRLHGMLLFRPQPEHSPQKTGLFNANTRLAHLLGSELFVKRSQADSGAHYPDFHCSCEIFTNGDFLELETLGPLVDLEPGATAEHMEGWSQHPNIQLASLSEGEIARVIQPLF